MHKVTVGHWALWIEDGQLPSLLEVYLKEAEYSDEVRSLDEVERNYFVGVSRSDDSRDWPEVIVIVKCGNCVFSPGVLLVPETSFFFVGAGETLLGYDLDKQQRVFEDFTHCGFWDWTRHENLVFMSAELEFGVWTLAGEILWSTFVEPPWSYKVSGPEVTLDVMGTIKTLDLKTGEERC